MTGVLLRAEKPAAVAQARPPSTLEAEAGRLQVPAWLGKVSNLKIVSNSQAEELGMELRAEALDSVPEPQKGGGFNRPPNDSP